AEQGEHARPADVARLLGLGTHVVEKWRAADEAARFLPREGCAGAGGERAPLRRAFADLGVTLAVKRRVDRLRDDAVDLAAFWPYVAQIHRPPFPILAERLGREVDQHAAGKRIGHHERRRRGDGGAHRRMPPAPRAAAPGLAAGSGPTRTARPSKDRSRALR